MAGTETEGSAAADGFAALGKPATESVPSAIRGFFASPAASRLAKLGVDVDQTRRLAVGDHAFYVTPGTDAICIFGRPAVGVPRIPPRWPRPGSPCL